MLNILYRKSCADNKKKTFREPLISNIFSQNKIPETPLLRTVQTAHPIKPYNQKHCQTAYAYLY